MQPHRALKPEQSALTQKAEIRLVSQSNCASKNLQANWDFPTDRDTNHGLCPLMRNMQGKVSR